MSLRLYTLLMRLLLPLALVRLYLRSLKAPAYRQRIAERLGRDLPGPPPCEVWVHAVSVGEVQAAAPLIRHLIERDPPLAVLVTTTTPTGAERLARLFGERVSHRYTPLDLPAVVERFLIRAGPRLLVTMETEIWPNLLAACTRRGVPAVLANARLSERSAKGYGRLQPLMQETLRRFDLIAAQDQADARRFVALGADPARVRVTGNLKFDQPVPADLQERAEALRRLLRGGSGWSGWGGARPLWVAASTHEGEEEQVLAAHRSLCARIPDALLVLVPRHPERFERVAALAAREGFSVVRRSAQVPCTPETAVFLVDSMGELTAFLAAVDAAFVGGSLVPIGGHNLLEAAAVGIPAATGPHVFNFAAVLEVLQREEAVRLVKDAAELADLMARWLTDAALRAEIGENGRRAVARNRGALARLIEEIDRRLPAPAADGERLTAAANPG